MKQMKTIFSWMGKNKYLYVLVLFMIIILAFSRTLVPQFGTYAIDTILSDKPSVLPNFMDNIVKTKSDPFDQVVMLVIVLVVYQTIRAGLMFTRSYIYSFASENTVMNLRNNLYAHLQKLPFSYYKTRNAGDIIQRCTTDMDVVKTFISEEILGFVWIIAMISATIYQMIRIDLVFSLISLCIFPIILIISILFFKKTYVQFGIIDEKESQLIDTIKENVTGVQVVKAFGAQKYEHDKYSVKSGAYYDELGVLFKLISKLYGSTSFLTALQTFIIMITGIYFVRDGNITLGTLVLFLSYTKLISYPINMLARLITRFGRNFVAIDRINEIFESDVETIEFEKPVLNGNIEFKNVSFSYPDGNVKVLDDVSFKIKSGTRVALIGKTGSGKSTVSYLLSRLFEPDSGSIYIDNHDITKINKEYLRNEFGFVVQEPYLFSKEISKNIAIKNDEFTLDDVIHYAKVANIHDDIDKFEKGYETEVGEHGTTLSGGQKQRVAIARMLINNHKVLIFDDSLSAVDNETDLSIRRALGDIEGATTITITHRITSVLDCDQIIVFDNGKLIESGSIDELLSSDGYFATMYKNQVGEKNE